MLKELVKKDKIIMAYSDQQKDKILKKIFSLISEQGLSLSKALGKKGTIINRTLFKFFKLR